MTAPPARPPPRMRPRLAGARDATIHPADFATLPDVPRLTLANQTAPSRPIGAPGRLAPLELTIEGRRSVSGRPHQSLAYRVNNRSR